MLNVSQRKIRSFVLRAGKLTKGQQRAVVELLPKFVLDETILFEQQNIFNNNNPVFLDVGFGNGESLIHIARMYPNVNFVGMEVHTPGIGHLLLEMEKYELTNIRIYKHDVVEVLNRCFTSNSIDALHIYFPDPWHKKRHHKRRLIQSAFMQSIIVKLKANARLHIATDWQPYAEHILEVLAEFKQFDNSAGENKYSSRPEWRPVTKFERRGINLGHASYDLIYQLIPKSQYRK